MTTDRNAAAAQSEPGTEASPSTPGALSALPVAVGIGAYACTVALLTGAFGFALRWAPFFESSDIPLYFGFARALERGLRPGLDFPVEYPSLALRLFALPGHPAELGPYALWFAALMVVAMGGAATLIALTAAQQWSRGRACLAGAFFAAAALGIGALWGNRFDGVVALFLAMAFWALAGRRFAVAGVAIGLATALKVVPAVLLAAPLLLSTRWRERAITVVSFGLAVAAPSLLDGQRGFHDWLSLVRFHGARPLQLESLLATPLHLAHQAGLLDLTVAFASRSHAVVAPGAAALAAASAPITAVLLAFTIAAAWRARRRGMPERRWLPLCCTGLLLCVMVGSKVLSPQFLVWLVPAGALVAPGAPRLAGLLLLAAAMTGAGFPRRYFDVVALQLGPVLLVAARNAALAAALAWVVALLARQRVGEGAAAAASVERPGAGLLAPSTITS